jgi:phage terminase small subunit
MPALENSRHELFAQAVASGKSASEAYRRSGANDKNADVHAARLMVNDSICKRVAELKAAQSQKSELSRDQAREFLTQVI